jgi:kumamolisin
MQETCEFGLPGQKPHPRSENVQVGLDLRRSRRFLFVLALTALALVIAIGASATSAVARTTTRTPGSGSGSNNQPTAVSPGVTASKVPGVTVFGTTAANTPETVSFVLREQNSPWLSAQVEGGMRHFLSVSQFANEYGQSPFYISQLTSYLSHYGITTQVYPDDIDVVATGTAGEFDSALDTTQDNYSAPAIPGEHGQRGWPAQSFHGATSDPYLPRFLATGVTAIFGLTNYSPFESNTTHVSTSVAKPNASSTSSCENLTGLPNACHLPQDYANQYGLTGLYKQGAEGQGQTVAIVTLAALDPGAPEYYWQNVENLPAASAGRPVTVNNVDGGPGAPSDASGSGETDLDVEQSGGVAPGANVVEYQAPNTDSGFFDAYVDAASQNLASSVSSSWGESETILAALVASGEETPAYETAFDEVFEEFAAQGQSAFTASGDAGAYDASDDLGTTNLSVDTSSDSPYITAAGGTTLPWQATLGDTSTGTPVSVDVSAQRIWGWDYLWQPVAELDDIPLLESAQEQIAGSTGGFSTIEAEPSYQYRVSGTSSFSAVPELTSGDYENVDGIYEPTVFSAVNPNPAITYGRGQGRAVPDLATDADPYTGYLLYEPSFAGVGQPVLQGGWGGTSFVAPQLNGSAAVIDSYLGRRVGFWNPTLYAAAGSRNSPFTPLNTQGTSNDNLYYTGTPGTAFNEGAGLGTPNLTALAADF